MEAGLKADFAAADTNHDGVLELDEVRAVNDKRWSEDASASSPLVDWNHDGVVDFDEFAATARSLFDQMDTTATACCRLPNSGRKEADPVRARRRRRTKRSWRPRRRPAVKRAAGTMAAILASNRPQLDLG